MMIDGREIMVTTCSLRRQWDVRTASTLTSVLIFKYGPKAIRMDLSCYPRDDIERVWLEDLIVRRDPIRVIQEDKFDFYGTVRDVRTELNPRRVYIIRITLEIYGDSWLFYLSSLPATREVSNSWNI